MAGRFSAAIRGGRRRAAGAHARSDELPSSCPSPRQARWRARPGSSAADAAPVERQRLTGSEAGVRQDADQRRAARRTRGTHSFDRRRRERTDLSAARALPRFPRIGRRLRGGWRWPQGHESEALRRWLLRARAPAGCRAGVAVADSVCIPRGDRQGAHSCGGAGWWGRDWGREGSSRQVAPPNGAFDAGLRLDPFPDRTARLLPSLLVAPRTGPIPAGDDDLMLVSATRYPSNSGRKHDPG